MTQTRAHPIDSSIELKIEQDVQKTSDSQATEMSWCYGIFRNLFFFYINVLLIELSFLGKKS